MRSSLGKCFAGGHVARPIQQQAANDGCVIEALKQSGIGLLEFRKMSEGVYGHTTIIIR